MVYARTVGGKVLEFGVSGKLIMNSLVMYDRQTDSLWSQFLGSAVEGEYKGTSLEFIPSEIVLWSAWRDRHPEGKVLDKLSGGRFDSYAAYYVSNEEGILGETYEDDRLDGKDLVVGIVGAGAKKAYAYRQLLKTPVVNDTFDDRAVVVALDGASGGAGVYYRTLGDRALSFDSVDDHALMVDRETGSKWQKSTGLAVDGELRGNRLERLPSFLSFWFAWTDFHLDTELYDPEQG